MPDLSGLAGTAGPVAALLVPVVMLLFVALRLRKRLLYPHELLLPREDSRPLAALLHSLRLYYDTALDATCAVIIGFVLAGYPQLAPRREPATILDCSLSMLSGMRGDRPLDEATRLILADETIRGSVLFALDWDPIQQKPRLTNLSKTIEGIESPQELALMLESTRSFMSVDFTLLHELTRKGYDNLTLITDDDAVEGINVTIRMLTAKQPEYLLPATALWDEDRKQSVVHFVTAGGAAITTLWHLNRNGSLSRAKPEDYTMLPGPSGFELWFPEPGLWAVQWEGHIVPFEAPGQPSAISATGAFAERLVAALGPIGSNAETRASKVSGKDRTVIVRDGGGYGKQGFLSVSMAEEEPAVLPPRLTLGTVVPAGVDRHADLPLGPAALASPEAAIPFWVARAAYHAGTQTIGTARYRPVRVGDGFLYPAQTDPKASLAVPPPAEYAPDGRRVIVTAGEKPDHRLIVTLILALLYGLKLLFSRKFQSS